MGSLHLLFQRDVPHEDLCSASDAFLMPSLFPRPCWIEFRSMSTCVMGTTCRSFVRPEDLKDTVEPTISYDGETGTVIHLHQFTMRNEMLGAIRLWRKRSIHDRKRSWNKIGRDVP